MLPREPFVSSVVNRLIVSGNGTTFVGGNLQVGDNTWTPEYAGMDGNDLAVHGQFEQRGSGGARVYRLTVSGNDTSTIEGNLQIGHNTWTPGLRSVVENKYFEFRNPDGTAMLGIWSVNGGGHLNMRGHSIINCSALTEANLQTPEEIAAGRVERFEEGDVLCWADNRLEKCSKANDRLVQAVADAEGRPIVIGAGTIKMLGPVGTGDILVASDVPGYAMVNNDPRPGTVIAQALEDYEGEQGLVKAMIRTAGLPPPQPLRQFAF